MAREKQKPLFEDLDPQTETTRALLDRLLSESRLYHTTDGFHQLMQFVVRHRNFAPFNAMLLQLQKPGLSFAASAYEWLTLSGRAVKEDARPLLIMWPFGPVAMVYDILDTYDIANPQASGLPANMTTFFATGDISDRKIRGFEQPLRKKRIILEWVDKGDNIAGRIQRIPEYVPKAGSSVKAGETTNYLVKVNQNHSPAVQFSTIVHELAHLFLGHLGPDDKLKVPARRVLSHSEIEIEAESVAYLVCQRNGVDANSEAYLAQFADEQTKADRIDIYQIMRAAGQIEAVLSLSTQTAFSGEPEHQLTLSFENQ